MYAACRRRRRIIGAGNITNPDLEGRQTVPAAIEPIVDNDVLNECE